MALADPKVSLHISGRVGTNGATSYSDEKGNGFSASGDAALTNVAAYYGPFSLAINNSGTGDYWSTTEVTPWVLGAGDFCIELWVDQESDEAIYLDNSGQNGNAGWRVGCWNSGGGPSGSAIYFYSDVGGFFTYDVSVAPNGSGARIFRWARRNGVVSVYDGPDRIGQYADATNYNIKAATAYIGRANNDFTFRPFVGRILARITLGSDRQTNGGATLPDVPSALDGIILPQPALYTTVGATPTLSLALDGSPTGGYQWFLNESPISGANSSTYTLPAPLTTADDGAAYSVDVEYGGYSVRAPLNLFLQGQDTAVGRGLHAWAARQRNDPMLLRFRTETDAGPAVFGDWLDMYEGLAVPAASAVGAQTLAGVTHTAVVATAARASASQVLADATSSASAVARGAASAAQTLAAVAQTAAGQVSGSAAAAQILGSVTQSATALTTPLSTAAAAQTLEPVSQTATGAARSAASAAQTLAGVSQTASAAGVARAAAAQILGDISQAATVGGRSGVSATQILAGASQTATVTVTAVPGALAAQVLAGVAQTATTTATAKASAAQQLQSVVASATAAVLAKAQAVQTLADVSQSAQLGLGQAGLQAAQILADVAQAAAALRITGLAAAQPLAPVSQVALAVRLGGMNGQQVLANVVQLAAVSHTYFFEPSERTYVVAVERRNSLVKGEERRWGGIAPERRRRTVTAEDRNY